MHNKNLKDRMHNKSLKDWSASTGYDKIETFLLMWKLGAHTENIVF